MRIFNEINLTDRDDVFMDYYVHKPRTSDNEAVISLKTQSEDKQIDIYITEHQLEELKLNILGLEKLLNGKRSDK